MPNRSSPRKAIWTLAVISAVIGVIAVSLVFGDAGAPTDATIAALPHGIFSSFGYISHDKLAALPNSLLTITLTSNFGTFILYALSCFLCIVAFHKRPDYNLVKHLLIPGFGLLANLVCMAFYLIGPVLRPGHHQGTAAGAGHLRPSGASTEPSTSFAPRKAKGKASCSNPSNSRLSRNRNPLGGISCLDFLKGEQENPPSGCF